jgi:hypothetical protein
MHVHRAVAGCLAATFALGNTSSAAQLTAAYAPRHVDEATFRFAFVASSALQVLWQSSVAAKQERVACIGGYQSGGVIYIERVQRVAEYADSLYASAGASLRQCGPPQWLGTVHTHIARQNGIPYVTFSAADRGVMRQWHQLWQVDGVFCVLYDYRHAYCEAGEDTSGEALYAAMRGNNLAH